MSNGRAVSSTYLEWAKLCSQAKYNLATSGITSYPLVELDIGLQDLEINGAGPYGTAPLQERLARKSGVTPDCIVAAAGTSMANHLAMAALIELGDDVLIERPSYGPVLEVASYLRGNILRFERRADQDFQVDPDEIARQMTPKTRLICLTNLHNPSGALVEEETLVRIGKIAEKAGAQVLVDEVYLDMVYDRPVRSSFDLGSNFVVTTSLTKAYGLSGLRCGWIVAQPNLAKRMWRLNDLFAATPVHPGELLSMAALDQLSKIDGRARALLATNRKALDEFFNGRSDVDGFRSRWGTVVFPRLKNGSVDEFCRFLRDRYETSVVPGRFFEMPDHFRIGIGGDPTMTSEALQRLSAALDEWGTDRS